MSYHLFEIARYDNFIGSKIQRILPLAFGGSKGHDLRYQSVRQFDAHMTETTDAYDPDFLPSTPPANGGEETTR